MVWWKWFSWGFGWSCDELFDMYEVIYEWEYEGCWR